MSDRVIPREGESGSIQYAGALQFITGALEYWACAFAGDDECYRGRFVVPIKN